MLTKLLNKPQMRALRSFYMRVSVADSLEHTKRIYEIAGAGGDVGRNVMNYIKPFS